MASNPQYPTDPSPEALAAVLRVLQSVDARLGRLEGRMTSVVPRRHITDAVKQRHVDAVSYLGGRCPCCGVTEVVDMGGRVLEAEFDHFYSRERRDFTETWLICRPCHLTMAERARHTDAFRLYQRRAREYGRIRQGELALVAPENF